MIFGMIGRLDFSSCGAPDFTKYHESAMGGQFSFDIMFASFFCSLAFFFLGLKLVSVRF